MIPSFSQKGKMEKFLPFGDSCLTLPLRTDTIERDEFSRHEKKTPLPNLKG